MSTRQDLVQNQATLSVSGAFPGTLGSPKMFPDATLAIQPLVLLSRAFRGEYECMPTDRVSDGDRGEIVIYQPPGGAATLDVRLSGETLKSQLPLAERDATGYTTVKWDRIQENDFW